MTKSCTHVLALALLCAGTAAAQPAVAPNANASSAGVAATAPPASAPPVGALAAADICTNCHQKITPNVVVDWKLSKHALNGVGCATCHGSDHRSSGDVARVKLPTADTCGQCHAQRLDQFKKSKHAFAWAALKAMPTFHYQPMALMEGLKGCGGCHKLGLKSEAEMMEVRKAGGTTSSFGNASCDACHTRHSFSLAEARSPQACQTCHMGFDHPQWEMYSGSKHGVRHELRQMRVIPGDTPAPTCQTCHMQQGDHEVRTAWGFLAVRLPLPEDKQWAADRVTILQGLGVLDPQGNPTPRLEVVKAAQVARLTQEEWQQQRDKMIATCNQCHSRSFAQSELAKGDDLIREADRLMAEGIRTVAALYRDGLLKKPASFPYAFPDLLTFHDAPSVPEQKLFVMFLEHRMRTFQGAFHNSPDYALWYGWSEMVRDLAEIKQASVELRARAGKPERKAAPARKP